MEDAGGRARMRCPSSRGASSGSRGGSLADARGCVCGVLAREVGGEVTVGEARGRVAMMMCVPGMRTMWKRRKVAECRRVCWARRFRDITLESFSQFFPPLTPPPTTNNSTMPASLPRPLFGGAVSLPLPVDYIDAR